MEASSKKDFTGALGDYLEYARARHPRLKALRARARSARAGAIGAERWPDPQISAGYFVSPVETRVGPQRARLGIKQTIPWPGGITAEVESAAAQARAFDDQVKAQALDLESRISFVYWSLWALQETQKRVQAHQVIVTGLGEIYRGRLATQKTDIVALQRLELEGAQLGERVASLMAEQAALRAHLRGLLGLPEGVELPTGDQPPEPGEASSLNSSHDLGVHPRITARGHLVDAQLARAEAISASGMPRFVVGFDWILVGARDQMNLEDDGRDALVVAVGMSIPLWREAVGAEVRSALELAEEARAWQQADRESQRAEIEATGHRIADAQRRVEVHRNTLLPQAQAAFDAALGAYSAGEASGDTVLLAQRTLLDLQISEARGRADYAIALAQWAALVGESAGGPRD
ncbi:MAG: TolC family protein [Bradymonadia bacterium]